MPLHESLNRSFPFSHTLATVAIGPLILALIFFRDGDFKEALGFYPFILIFGLLFAIPFLILYYFLLQFASRRINSTPALRVISTVFTIIGIIITFYFISHHDISDYVYSYGIAAVLSGFFFQIRHPENASPPLTPEKKLRNLFLFAILSFALAFMAQVMIWLRTPLLGIPPGVGGHNAAFNIAFYIPVTLLAGLIAYFTAGNIILGWREFKNLKLKVLSLLLTLPTIVCILYYILSQFRYR